MDTVNIRDVVLGYVKSQIKSLQKENPRNDEIDTLQQILEEFQKNEVHKSQLVLDKQYSNRALKYIDKITNIFAKNKPESFDDHREYQLFTVLGDSPQILADAIKKTDLYNKGKEFLYNNAIVDKGSDIINHIKGELNTADIISSIISAIGISAVGFAAIKTGVVLFAIAAYYGFKYYTGTRKYGEDVVSRADFIESLDIFCLADDSVLQVFKKEINDLK